MTFAPVSVDDSTVQVPAELAFELHDVDEGHLSTRADAFLVGLLPVAMRLGEDIEVEGPVSTMLAFGLQTWQETYATWFPEIYRTVAIRYAALDEADEGSRPGGVGCTFSGGLDSWYAVYRSLPQQQPVEAYRLSHALIINGFDQVDDARNPGAAEGMRRAYTPLLQGLGIAPLMVTTNLRQFRIAAFNKAQLVSSYGSALVACAHAAGGMLGRFGMATSAGLGLDDLKPDGSHFVTDHLLSSGALQVFRIGGAANRRDKLEALADVPEVQQGLRVCVRDAAFDPETGRASNCGECLKCLRTIVALDIIGKLEEFTSMSNRCPVEAYRNPQVLARSSVYWINDNLELARKHQRNDWIAPLESALAHRKALVEQTKESGAR